MLSLSEWLLGGGEPDLDFDVFRSGCSSGMVAAGWACEAADGPPLLALPEDLGGVLPVIVP